MKETTYIVGEKVAGGYPSGRYVCTKLEGKVHDHFFVRLVLDYPSVRAVANNEAWSNTEVKPYEKLISCLRSTMMRHPEEYEGTITGLTKKDYDLSLMSAIERAIEEYEAKEDTEAVDKLREKLQEAVENIKTLSA